MAYQKESSTVAEAMDRYHSAGIGSLSDSALIAIITGTEGRASQWDSYPLGELPTTAPVELRAALELGRRQYGSGTRVGSPRDLYPLVAHYADRKQERFLCVSLNGAHEIIATRVVTVGLVNRTMVHPREMFADPITDRACAVVLAHNHPSGKLEPSAEDRDITKRLVEAGEVLGIAVLDHLVISTTGYYSFVEHGLMSPAEPD